MARGVDFSNFKKYAENWQGAKEDLYGWLSVFLLEQAERLIGRTKERTPVDTGALRETWQIGELTGFGETLQVEILNGMEYASHVEYGHRIVVGGEERGFVEGRFMLTISLDEIYAQMPARFSKGFKEFLAERGIGT